MKIINRIAQLMYKGDTSQARLLLEKTMQMPIRAATPHKEMSLRIEITYAGHPSFLEVDPCLRDGFAVRLSSPGDFGVCDDDARAFESHMAHLLGRDWVDIAGMRSRISSAEAAVKMYRQQLEEALAAETKGT